MNKKFTFNEIFEIIVGNITSANLSVEKGDYDKAISLLKFTNQMIVTFIAVLNNPDIEEDIID